VRKKMICSDKAPAPVGPYSQAVRAGEFLFVSGQIPMSAQSGEIVTGSFDRQVRTVLDNITVIIQDAGFTLDNVVKVTIFLADMDRFAELNAIYDEYFGEARPARSCVEVSRLPKGVPLEIEAIAMTHRRETR